MKKIKNISTLICIIMLSICFIYLALIYRSLPNMLPSHFDFMGNPSSYEDKISVFTLPLIGILVLVIFEAVSHFPSLWNYPVKVTEENRAFLYNITMMMLSIIKVLVTILLIYVSLCTIYSFLPLALIYVVIVLMLIVTFGSIYIMLKGR